MLSKKECTVVALSVAMLVAFVFGAFAQLNPFAPTSIIEEQASAPVGSASGGFIDRARGAANTDGRTGRSRENTRGRGSRVVAPTAPSPVSAGPALMPGLPGAPGIEEAPEQRMIKVRTGERIYCHICGEILQDAVEKNVPEDERPNYYDDGTHGDVEADDSIYSNITQRNNVIGADCGELLQHTIALVRNAEELNPLEFFSMHVTTKDPLSAIPKTREEEKERDILLDGWNNKFLRRFRRDPDVPDSEFYSIYVPPPPEIPEILPPTAPREDQQGGGGGPAQSRRGRGSRDVSQRSSGYYNTDNLRRGGR